MTALSALFPAPTGGGAALVVLDRRIYTSSGTWSKPADGAGNVRAGVGVLAKIDGVGGGGSHGFSSTNLAGGDTTFRSSTFFLAQGGQGGQSAAIGRDDLALAVPGGLGGAGSYAYGQSGVSIVLARNQSNTGWRNEPGPGWRLDGIASLVGRGSSGLVSGTNAETVRTGGGAGGRSLCWVNLAELAASETVTIGAGGINNFPVDHSATAGALIVEVWGTPS